MRGHSRLVVDEFDRLQARLPGIWPSMTLRTTRPQLRTVIVVQSLSLDLPPHIAPVLPAYEERFLCLVLTLLRAQGSRVIYLTSLPVAPRVVDYWFGLTRGLATVEARSRMFQISPADGSARPLAAKLLDRPRLLERVRSLIVDPELAVIVPFMCSPLEARFALALDVPVYGTNPRLWALGSKSNARRLFAGEGIPHPAGFEGLRDRDDLVEAIGDLRRRCPGARRAVVKLDQGVGGLGNASVPLDRPPEAAVAALEPEDGDASAEAFLAALAQEGGVVEERIEAEELRSPSVQLRASPDHSVEVLSTHDQVVGGPRGLTFLGSRFPADAGYRALITGLAVRAGRRLAEEGVLGRFALDFIVTRNGTDAWRAHALEINLRCGGTTPTFIALQALTDGVYDPEAGEFTGPDGRAKYYTATDHLESPGYARLTPDDLFDVIDEHGLRWDERSQTGIAFHMASAVAVAGRVGATAIGDSPAEADAHLARARAVLDAETAPEL